MRYMRIINYLVTVDIDTLLSLQLGYSTLEFNWKRNVEKDQSKSRV
jgi:hypothetical protein